MDNLRIRKVRIEDADDIGKIYEAIVKKNQHIDFNRIIEEQLRNSGVVNLVAEFQERVVGYMISYTLSGGFGIDKSAWIAMLGVDPKFMGKGIGKKLAEEICEYYSKQGIHNVYTSVRWDSTDLLSFFKTLNFDRSNFINLRKVLK